MKNLNRWIYILVGFLVLCVAGLVYSWSIFSANIEAEFTNVSQSKISLTFSICMATFCLGGLFGGFVQRRIDIRLNIILSAILFFIGFIMSSNVNSIEGLYITYGILCGFASGLAYNGVLSNMVKWFPDKTGLISGILLMGFGMGNFVVGNIYQKYTPRYIGGWRVSFIVMGVVISIIVLIGSMFFVKHDEETDKNFSGENLHRHEISPFHMIKTKAFWLYIIWTVLLSASGLVIISQGRNIITGVNADINLETVAIIVGLISVANGMGRIIFGTIFDLLGRKKEMKIIEILFAISILILILYINSGNIYLAIIGYIGCGLSYGGITATNSAFTNDLFGKKNYASNFSIVSLSLIIASFISNLGSVLYNKTDSYYAIFIGMIIFVFIGSIGSIMIKN